MVCLEGQLAATLDVSGSRHAITYTDAWLSQNGAYPLSQSLPLQPGPLRSDGMPGRATRRYSRCERFTPRHHLHRRVVESKRRLPSVTIAAVAARTAQI